MSALRRPRKAVFPVAGLGASFLPATKACPKELLPVVDRPLIQYAVEEAAAAGIHDMIFVTGRNKRAIEDHFDTAYELERELTARDDRQALRALQSAIPPGVTFTYVRQPRVAGLGDALLRARALTGDEPFAVLLPDDLIDCERPALTELIDVHEQTGAAVVAVEALAPDAPQDGAVVVDEVDGAIRCVIESAAHAAGATLVPIGRCVLTPSAWDALCRAGTPAPATLPAMIAALIAQERVLACEPGGRRYDCGTKLGYLQAQLAYARKHPDLWPQLRASLEALVTPAGPSARGTRYARQGDEAVASLG